MDVELRQETRFSAAEIANELIGEPALYAFVRSILLSEAVPIDSTEGSGATLRAVNPDQGEGQYEATFAVSGLLSDGANERLEDYSRLISEVKAHQPALKLFWKHWSKLETDASLANEGVESGTFREALLRLGVVPGFANAIRERNIFSFNGQVIAFAVSPEVQQMFPRASRVLTLLRNSLEADGAFDQKQLFPRADELPQDDEEIARVLPSRTADARSMFEHVTRQIEGIRKLLVTGSMSNVSRAVTELLEFQRDSDSEYLAKTLCNLAAIAIDANEPHLAQYLSDRALELGEEDVIVFNTRAEVFKRLGRFDDARRAYEETIARFGRTRYTNNGYADVLMDSGLFDRSLEVYKEVVRLYPDDPVAPNGIATVHFARGHISLALDAAQKNVAVYGDAVSRVICGNFLRHVGRYHESLRLARESVKIFPHELVLWGGLVRSLGLIRNFDKAIKESDELLRRFPESPLPWVVKGDILSRAGDLSGSLDAYTSGLRTFTSHRPLQIGRASILTLFGRNTEASDLLKDLELESEVDWRGYHVLALSKLKSGLTEQAIHDLKWAAKNTPWRNLRVLFESSLGYAYMRQGQQKVAIDLFEGNLLRAPQNKRQGLLLFLGSAFREMGQEDRSISYVKRALPTDESTEILLRALSETAKWKRTEQIEVAEFDLLLAA
jgi:tetratricopeptide (TPR) repeat protein